MKIESVRKGTAAVVVLSGRLDAESAPQFDTVCEEHLKDGVTHFVIGMADLSYVSSMGLRSFLVIAKQTKSRGGGVSLCGMKGFVKEVFDLTNVTPLFRLFDTTEAAATSI
jgi:anti-anti-sigma factor